MAFLPKGPKRKKLKKTLLGVSVLCFLMMVFYTLIQESVRIGDLSHKMMPWLGSLLIAIMGTSAICLIGILYFVLIKMDAGTRAIDARVSPETLRGPYAHRSPNILVTYGSGPEVFLKNQHMLVQSALGKGFDTVHIYRQGHIDPAFYEKHRRTLEQPRGGGYWLWKPYFILRALEASLEGTYLTYADSGVVFSKSMASFYTLLEKTPIIFSGNGTPRSIRTYLKMEARQALGIAPDDPVLDFVKVCSGFIIFKNTPETRSFVKEWLALCEVREALTDDPCKDEIQDPVFIRHLHDESLVSLVLAKYPNLGTIIGKKELIKKYGVTNPHRHPHQEQKSALFMGAGLPEWLSDILFNNPLIVFVRTHLMF